MKRRFRVKCSFYTDVEIDITDNSTDDISELVEEELNKGYVCENLKYSVEKELVKSS